MVIIPAAGLGTRVGSPPAKELLPHPKADGSFLDVALKRIKEINATPLVISRVDKIVLNEWLFINEIPHILITKTPEWVQTVLLSKNYWRKKNILLLPDADFLPAQILKDITLELDRFSLTFATFPVEDIRFWGSVKKEFGNNYVSEKNHQNQSGIAWGIIGFSKEAGEVFWPLYLESQLTRNWVQVPVDFSVLPLSYFVDLTR